MTEHKITHWVDSEKQRASFWKQAGELGMDQEQVYAALGVQHVHDYPGTAMEAKQVLAKYAMQHRVQTSEELLIGAEPEPFVNEPEPQPEDPPDEPEKRERDVPLEVPMDLVDACAKLPEAPALAWTEFVDKAGFKWSMTLRAGLPTELAKEALRTIVPQMGLFHKLADTFGWMPVWNAREAPYTPKQNGKPAPVKPQPAPSGAPNAPVPPPPVPPVAQPAAPAVTPAPTAVKGGVMNIDRVVIKQPAEGKYDVEFWKTGRKYPDLRWQLGGEALIKLFSTDLVRQGWTAAHFDQVKEFAVAFQISWQESPKNPKWKDITKVDTIV